MSEKIKIKLAPIKLTPEEVTRLFDYLYEYSSSPEAKEVYDRVFNKLHSELRYSITKAEIDAMMKMEEEEG